VVARLGAIPSVATAATLCGGDSATAAQALGVLAWYGGTRPGVRALTMDATVLPMVAQLLRTDPLGPSNALLLLTLVTQLAAHSKALRRALCKEGVVRELVDFLGDPREPYVESPVTAAAAAALHAVEGGSSATRRRCDSTCWEFFLYIAGWLRRLAFNEPAVGVL
jgi:hypothetical protein